MNKNNLAFGVFGLVIGLAIGFFIANSINKSATNSQTIAEIPNSPSMANPQGNLPIQDQTKSKGGMQVDVQKTLDKAEKEPESYDAQIAAGKMYAKIERFDEALEHFRKAQKLKPEDFDANAQLGNAYFDAKKFEDAEKAYEMAIEITPDNVTVQSDYATTFFQRSNPDYERAIKEFEKALSINSKHDTTLYNLGLTYKRINNPEMANETLKRLKETNPESDLIKRLDQVLNK